MKHRRIIVTHYGGSEALEVREEECPEPSDVEVRVNVLAAGVCLPDIMMREGIHPVLARRCVRAESWWPMVLPAH